MAETYSLIKMLYMYIYIYSVCIHLYDSATPLSRGHVKLFQRYFEGETSGSTEWKQFVSPQGQRPSIVNGIPQIAGTLW